jgi:hypothetical protein
VISNKAQGKSLLSANDQREMFQMTRRTQALTYMMS